MTIKNYRFAFTLAEVLITLGIIGIIAAITIPSIISKADDREAVTRLLEISSILEQAVTMAVSENGTLDQWNIAGGNVAASKDVNKILSKYLKVSKDCGTGPGCFAPGTVYKSLSLAYDAWDWDGDFTTEKIVLANGAIVGIQSVIGGSGGLDRVYLYTDINGQKGPNQMGYDVFTFIILSVEDPEANIAPWKLNAAVPFGYKTGPLTNDCDATAVGTGDSGNACAAWVVYNKNRDYLHCNGLNWETKTSCE